jgi:hypothetical protein
MRREHTTPQGGGVLPPGYTQLEYIESTGTQYIDTGLVAPDGFSFLVDVFVDTSNQNNPYIVGSHNLSSPYGRNGVGLTQGAKWQLGLGDTYPTSTATPVKGVRLTIDGSTVKGNSFLKLNGTNIITSTDSSLRSSNNLLIFYNQYERNRGGQTLKGKLYAISLTVSGVMHTYTPALRIADSKPGMYDIINNIFYTNQGTGEFLYA